MADRREALLAARAADSDGGIARNTKSRPPFTREAVSSPSTVPLEPSERAEANDED